jgi:S1-C subfamily serine protease
VAIKDGLAITAWHLVKDAKRVIAKFSSGEEFEVSGLVDKDEKRDVAIVKIKVFGRPCLDMNPMDSPIGSKSYVIGSPKGLEFAITEGLVSQIQTIDGIKYYQFSCPASPGNSGGPLVNGKGEVIGVVSWQLRDGQNLNFAIPVSYVLGLDSTLPTQPWSSVTTTAPIGKPAATDSVLADTILADAVLTTLDAETAVNGTLAILN